jgi:CHRD domain/PEP-CTERM motif
VWPKLSRFLIGPVRAGTRDVYTSYAVGAENALTGRQFEAILEATRTNIVMLTPQFRVCSVLLILASAPSTLPAATVYTTILLGANEVPPTGSAGTGAATVTLNGNLLTVDEVFSGLTASASAAHIHCCGPVGVNDPVALPFTGFPNVVSGTYMQSFDLTLAATYTAAFVTASGGTGAGAEAALIAALNAGQTYANIHDSNFPGGEIRGQLQPTPEPATAGLLLLGLAAMIATGRRAARAEDLRAN